MGRAAGSGVVLAALTLSLAWGCGAGSGPSLLDEAAGDGGGTDPGNLGQQDAAAQRQDVDLGDPFTVEGLTPSHGPWTGGTRVVLRGRGFPSKLRVWIGDVEVPQTEVLASEPTRASAVTPPGIPGATAVRVRDDSTGQERILPGGFLYDAFDVEPQSGATSGGTRIALKGSGTAWPPGTTVSVGGKACRDVVLVNGERIECVTPASGPGSADVSVSLPDGTLVQARDAFTYADTQDGYRGGLSGAALAGNLKVLVLDSATGAPLPGAVVLVGDTAATALKGLSSASGATAFSDATLAAGSKVTVTVAAKCHQPVTYVDVPVDTVTVYLDATMDLACASGDPPSTGGRGGRFGAIIEGELVWPGVEFQRGAWNNVPSPVRPTERMAAYVFLAAGSPTDGFQLPAEEEGVTPASPGRRGYAYSVIGPPGNLTLYAVAGIEDRSVTPAKFTPFAMGVVRGASAQPNARTTGVDIPMTSILDHRVTLAPEPPTPAVRGPDRLQARLAVSLGQGAYAVLPAGLQSRALPFQGTVPFVGVPALAGVLAPESFVVSAAAVTGAGGFPASVVSRLRTTNTSDPVPVKGFLEVPVLDKPGSGSWTGTEVQFQSRGAYNLAALYVTSGNGLVTWTIYAPGSTDPAPTTRSFKVPDLSPLPDNMGLVAGPIQTLLYIARVESFDYGKLRSGQLNPGAWNAYATDSLAGAY